MIKAAIIGLGWWGKIITSMVRQSDRIQIIGAVEVDRKLGEEFCGANGLRLYDSYEAALADPRIDAVILTTPHRFHVGQIVAAAEAKKHVFCEKPLSLTLEGAVRAVRACRSNGVRLAVGHERRFEPPVQMVRSMLEDGTLGTLLQIESNFSQNKFLTLSPDNWRLSTAEASCGPMTATGIHLLDFAVSAGGGATRVYAKNNTLATGFESGDSLSTVLELRCGATASISAMLATPFYGRLTVFGSKGWVEIRDKSHVEAPTGWTVVQRIGDQDPVTSEYPVAAPVRSNLEAFAGAIASRQEDYPMSMQDMLNTVSAFEAVFKATQSGKIEEVEQVSADGLA